MLILWRKFSVGGEIFFMGDGTNGIDGTDGTDGRNGKFPSSEALPIERSITHQAKRPHLSYKRTERIGKIGRIRNLGNLGKEYH